MFDWMFRPEIDPALLVAGFGIVFALGATAVALAAVWIASIRGRKNAELQQEVQALRDELNDRLRVVDQCSIGMGETIARMESRLNQHINERQGQEQDGFARITHQQLSKLVQMGASAEDLMKNCGLSKAEADLLLLLNSSKPAHTAEISEH